MSVSILRCLSEPSFMFVTHCQERNLCYFTQKSFLVVVVGGGIAIIRVLHVRLIVRVDFLSMPNVEQTVC